jgi:hypothetical protein
MENDDDFPKIGRDFQRWSELDIRLPKLDLDIELFIRQNVWIASFVILSSLLKSKYQQRQNLLVALTPRHFDPKSLARFLFEKIVAYQGENDAIPISELEKWIPEYGIDVWGSPLSERMLFAYQLRLRQILNFDPSEKQVNRAIELRKQKMDKYG